MKENENKLPPASIKTAPQAEPLNASLAPIGISTKPVTVIPSLAQSFVDGSRRTPAGVLPRVSSQLTFQDRRGSLLCRLGAGRMSYMVDPGLYALGTPDDQSPVLVSANYKMSFDVLRQAMSGRSAWILVLDTKGINVWCAAGKGTFGTAELVNRIETSGLKQVVRHRKIIVPQLGAPGVAAHQVKLFSGFRVYYGPVNASDLPAYLDAGLAATKEMREMTFSLRDRAELIPIEIVEALKPAGLIALASIVLSGLLGSGDILDNLASHGLFAVLALVLAIVAGAVLHPLLLPWLPGRAFSVKGLVIGLAAAAFLIVLRGIDWSSWSGRIEAAAWILIVPAIAAYLGMNFTGCSTYTSLSGVKKEMRFALPAQIAAACLGVVCWIASLILS